MGGEEVRIASDIDLTARDVPSGVNVDVDPAQLFSGSTVIFERGIDFDCHPSTLKKHLRDLVERYVGHLVIIEDDAGLMAQFMPGRDRQQPTCACRCCEVRR